MRWEMLFGDLEAQAEALSTAERAAEVEERTRIEFGRSSLSDRLRPAIGDQLQLSCVGAAAVRGRLARLGAQWCLVDEGAGREAVVALSAVSVVSGLGRFSAAGSRADLIESRLPMAHILRAMVRDRSTVRVELTDATALDGTLDRVGADFIEVASHAAGEARRRAEVRARLVVATRCLAVVRRRR
jgi:hypothetical protein